MRRFCRTSLTIAGLSLTTLLSFTTLSAHAQQAQYLLQFGQHETEAAAKNQWNGLKKNHADLLGKKELRIAEVTSGGTTRYRTQASGVANREEAIQTCNTLNLQSVTCMVVETSMITAQAARQNNEPLTVEVAKASTPSAAPFFLPWMNRKEDASNQDAETLLVSTETLTITEQQQPERAPAVVAPVIIEEPVVAPAREPVVQAQPVVAVAQQPVNRIVPERAPKNLAEVAPQTSAPAADEQELASSTAAVVEVSEAIPVPLSYNNYAPARVASRPVGYGGYPSQNLPQKAPWLQIGPFQNKDSAMGYWRDLSQQNPEMMRLLRVKITAPVANRYGGARTFLRFGPFQDQASVDFLCQKAAQQRLQCKGVQEMGNSIAKAPAERRYQQRYENRRQVQGLSASQVTQNKIAGMYYLQLGALSSAQEAKQRWEQLSTVHADLLGQLQPQVSYPANGGRAQPVYFLRTGPFVTAESAAQLCNRLKSRSLACVIVQAR